MVATTREKLYFWGVLADLQAVQLGVARTHLVAHKSHRALGVLGNCAHFIITRGYANGLFYVAAALARLYKVGLGLRGSG